VTKSCIQCGAKAEDWVTECEDCGRAFSFVLDDGSEASGATLESISSRARPDGSGLKYFGGILFAVALLAFLLGWLLPAAEYSFREIDPERLALKSNLMLFGGSGLQVGAMVWLAGAIIEAISFLPGKDD